MVRRGTPTKWKQMAAAVAGLALIVGACGGSDDTADTSGDVGRHRRFGCHR